MLNKVKFRTEKLRDFGKKLITLCLFLVITITLSAQDWNDISIGIIPENPTTNDEITINVSGQTISNMISVNTSHSIENGTINIQTEVYQGMYQIIDYFNAENNIGSLAAGTYINHFKRIISPKSNIF